VSRGSNPRGFSLVEVLIASGITAVVTLIACRLAVDAHVVWRADSARIDLQQRARVATDVVLRALLETGGGPTGGPARGPLIRVLPPVVPRRMGLRGAHPPGTVRSDAWTVVRAVAESEPAALLLPAPAGVTTVEIAPSPACGLPACGFAVGTQALLMDPIGNHDVFTVTAVQGTTLSLRHHGAGSAATYAAGTPVIAVESSSFFHDAAGKTLRLYDGDATDVPLVDDVVGVEVKLFGDVQPPVWPRPATGAANCLYETDGTYFAALMPVLPGIGGRTELTTEMLTDGPWCGSGPTRFDADLLRVRRVRVAIRLQASDPAARGGNPAQFRERGVARRSAAMVPDVTVVVDAAPRNLTQGW
jgi:prepilin-type N-terminal cleavage/methylation domain-containing protein